MYSKFNLTIDDELYNSEYDKYHWIGDKFYSSCGVQAKKNLRKFICNYWTNSGTAMQNSWFNIEPVDIFISHSHKDMDKVKVFAGWLYDNFKLKVFIDSCVWGYSDDLLKQIDDKYCISDDGNTYDYSRRNYSTSHVHMMLSTALSEMIDKSECVMFYNTPNSVSIVDDLETIKTENKKVTLSPWIYHELLFSNLVRQQKPKRNITGKILEHKEFSEQNNLNIKYDIDKIMEEFPMLCSGELIEWKKKYMVLTHMIDGDSIQCITGYEHIHPLDVLYDSLMTKK